MPLPMIHLSVAVKINRLNKRPEFYLGSISPDAVHMRDGYMHEDKVRSHCNVRKVAAINKLDCLCEKIRESEGEEQQFILGYLIHILTDIFWEDSIENTFYMRYEADISPLQDRRMAYYNDTDQLDFVFYDKEGWRANVWDMLKQSKDFSFEGAVRVNEVTMWKNRTLNWYLSGKSQHTNPVKYLSYNDLEWFTRYAAEKCEEYLLSRGLIEKK